MKAVRFHQHGGAEVLKYEEAPEPKIGPNDVLIRVKACALNHLDIWVRQGLPFVKIPLPHISGNDAAGEIVEKGEAVAHLRKGERVLVAPGISCGRCEMCLQGLDNSCDLYQLVGYQIDGGYAEYVKVPAVNALPIPTGLTFEEAASVPLVFLTAWHMLVTRAKLKPFEKVLIIGGGSGVGIAAIQLAKLLGAQVITTAGSEEKLQKCRGLGADETLNHYTDDIVKEAKAWTGGRGVDVVFEHVGPATWEKSIRSLAKNGRLVTCGATTGPEATLDIRWVFSRKISILGSYMGAKSELLEVLKRFEEKRLRAVVDKIFPLQEAASAQKYMEDKKQFGKILLIP
ncbi:MAG: zinc-binding dehydrogenase [Deltaproteobacteria bacterium]|nr:zinc-binding dehydrogenase [Deltaproteobacteria bacterium]